jgi:hypothetical protein
MWRVVADSAAMPLHTDGRTFNASFIVVVDHKRLDHASMTGARWSANASSSSVLQWRKSAPS